MSDFTIMHTYIHGFNINTCKSKHILTIYLHIPLAWRSATFTFHVPPLTFQFFTLLFR